jgi:hypothetical protein
MTQRSSIAAPAIVESSRSWAYVQEGKRDLRIDILRGIAVIVMCANHLTAHSYINAVTQGRIYVSAAEAFVFLSGLVLGGVSRGRLERDGWATARNALFSRAWLLYKTNLVLIALAVGLSFAHAGAGRPVFDQPPGTWWQILLAAPTFHLAPRIVDVLQLYVICIAGSPLLLWLLRRGLWVPPLVASWALWVFHQLHPYALSVHTIDRDHPFFVFASWQLLYVIAFIAGYHRAALQKAWARIPRALLLGVLVPIVVGSIVLCYRDGTLGTWPVRLDHRALWRTMTDRSALGPARLLTVAAFFPVAYMALHQLFRPVYRIFGAALLTLGQSSLYVYLVHVPLVVAWHAIPGLATANPIVTTLGQTIALLTLFLCTRYKILFGVIPR